MLRLLHSLPKPLLFGFYGALGGLLGALLFGELIWAVVSPPAAQAQPLRLAASPSVTAYWGGSNQIFVKIARGKDFDGKDFDGPVVVKASNLPPDITIPLIEIPAGKDDGAMKVTMEANGEKPVSGSEIEIELIAMAVHDSKISDSATLKVKVEIPLPSLALNASPEVRLFEGGSNRFAVKIARQNFEGPIRIDALNLPKGVHLPETTIPAGATETEVVVTADKLSALPRPQPIRLRGSLAHNPDLVATAPIDIMVVAAPPQLTVAVSPQVVLFPETSNKFTIKVARHRFEGPVEINALTIPDGIELREKIDEKNDKITVPADKNEIEVYAVSTNKMETGLPKTHRVPLRASAKTAKLEAAAEFDVRIEPFPPSMSIAVSPEVLVTQGGKGKFMVKLARRGFDDAVRVEFLNAPDGTTFPPAVIPANQTEVEVEMHAKFRAKVGKQPMTANGRAMSMKAVADARSEFVLDVAKAKDNSRVKADVMFVLDITGSMGFAINGVRDGIQQFAEMLEAEEIDARIGMIAFRDLIADKTSEPMKVLLFNGQPFTTDYKAFRAEVGKLKAAGGGDIPESSMEAIQNAAKVSYRPGVTKIMILITDAPPKGLPGITGTPLPKGLKGAMDASAFAKHALITQTKAAMQKVKIDQLHLVVRSDDQPVYQLLQSVAKGKFYDLQETVKGKAGFADLLPVLSKEIVVTTTAGRPDAEAAMAKPPAPPSSQGAINLPMVAAPAPPESSLPSPPKVKEVAPPQVAANVAPPSTEVPVIQGVQSTAVYAEADRWRLLAAIALWTAAIAAGISFVLVAGQSLYMSQRLLSLGQAFKALVGGAIAGLIGGALVQLLYQLSPTNPIVGAATRIVAWSVMGAILGSGMGLFIPNLRLTRSLLGGSLGGMLGAVGFIAAEAIGSSVLGGTAGGIVGRLIGAAFVGFFIGMMVAFAELAFRRYWLEVAFGKHEIRTITLGSTPVTIGTHDDAMIRVDAPKARTLAFHIDGDRVVCQNVESEEERVIQPGHQSTIGTVTVTMRSIEEARRIGFALDLSTEEEISLTEGMPLTAEEIPGLEAQGADGMVALVSSHPRDPKKLVLRNRSKQTWKARKPDGTQLDIAPGASIDIADNTRIAFGKVKATLKREDDE